MDQLVKYKDIREYIQLYIPNDHVEYIHCLRGNNETENEESIRKSLLLYEVLTNHIQG